MRNRAACRDDDAFCRPFIERTLVTSVSADLTPGGERLVSKDEGVACVYGGHVYTFPGPSRPGAPVMICGPCVRVEVRESLFVLVFVEVVAGTTF